MARVLAAALIAALLTTGCASGPPAFPDRRDAVVRVMVSPSTFYSGTYVVPGSQVEVTSTGWTTGVAAGVGGILLGGVGGLAASAMVDQVHSKQAVQGREAALAQRYDKLVADRVAQARVGSASSDTPAIVWLMPRAKLFAGKEKASLVCVLEASYSVGGMAQPFVHRVYSYAAPEVRPMVGSGDGWSDNDGAALRAIAQKAFVALADTFAADWHGRIDPTKGREVRVQRGAMKEPRAIVVVHEIGDYLVASSGTAQSPRTSSLQLVERSAVVP